MQIDLIGLRKCNAGIDLLFKDLDNGQEERPGPVTCVNVL